MQCKSCLIFPKAVVFRASTAEAEQLCNDTACKTTHVSTAAEEQRKLHLTGCLELAALLLSNLHT